MSETEKRITQLHRNRGALKTKNTIFQNLLDKPIAEIDSIELNSKLQNVKSVLEQFESIQTELEEIVSDDRINAEYAERIEFEEKISSLSSKARKILNEKVLVSSIIPTTGQLTQNLPGDSPPQENVANTSVSRSGFQQSNANVINLKLPALNLPTFSGSNEQWPGFSDTFKSSVHVDSRFTDAQKLIYLRSCLSGRAADKIESLQTTDVNYLVAWKILEKSYDDPTSVINNHIKAFFDLSTCTNSSAAALGELLNNVSKHYRALEALDKPFLESFPIYAVVSKLDPQTRIKWKEHTQLNNSPTMEELLEFLHSRERILETNKAFFKNEKSEKVGVRNENQSQSSHKPPNTQSKFKKQNSYFTHNRPFCQICKEAHYAQNCEKLTKATVRERHEIVKNLKLCCNCLRSNHTVDNCISSSCKTCNKKHHTLLHDDINETKSYQTNHAHLPMPVCAQVLLSTAVVHLVDNKGNPHACRALLDNGSQVNFMTEKFAKKLGLTQHNVEIPLGGVNQMSSSVSKLTRTILQSRLNKFSADLNFLITPIVSDYLPIESLNRINLKFPPKIHLADPDFDKPSEIDILIGGELFLKLLRVGQISLSDDLILQQTQLGWILGGKTPGDVVPNSEKCNLPLNLLHNKICEFWEIENGPSKKLMSNEEKACEIHYTKNTRRDPETGRYIVKLPFKEDPIGLGESYSFALKRFLSLERSLVKNNELREKYTEFMNEYLSLGHMTQDESNSQFNGYFLPHHAVIKQSSLTTKLRTVFDASAKTSNGKSLNDTLMIGPNIQDDLFSLLVRFRFYAYAITADIEKMYRQVWVHSDHQIFQKILWRDEPRQPVKIFKLKTVTYGTSSASFLATRTLVQLAEDEAVIHPHALTALKEDFYMDDLLTGAQTFEEAREIINELIEVTQKAGMNLRQWASNEFDLITALPQESNDSYRSLNLDSTTKTLGVYWNPKLDSFFYSIKNSNVSAPVTKRNILSEIAQLFDPLGLLGSVILQPKIIMQSLWQLNISWDEVVPPEITSTWVDYKNQLKSLEEIEIKRKIIAKEYHSLQILGFCDASKKAYGACIYLRSCNKDGTNSMHLICSKSRVAPLKAVSLPRLELCAALLLSNLFTTVIRALRRLHIERVIFWSDSTIVLHWIKSPSNILKTFVGNRVEEIQTLTQSVEWRHVRTDQNPADLISPGLSPREFITNSLWFNGPAWIKNHEEEWPLSHLEPIEIPEKKLRSVK